MIKQFWLKLKANPRRKIIFGLSALVLVGAIVLILIKAGIFASELPPITNTAVIYYDVDGATMSAQSNTVSTSVIVPSPSPTVSKSPTPTPSTSSTSRGKPTKTPRGHKR